MTDKPRLIEHAFPLKQASLREISRKAPCPCGSGRKYKKCCMPQAERGMPAGADIFADSVNPARMAAKKLKKAAGKSAPAARKRASRSGSSVSGG